MAATTSPTSPLISVLMPSYNADATVERAVASVLRQTEGNLELIVVDDASQDETVARLKRINDPRLSIIQKEKNEGAQAARNLAMEHARGEWVAFLDADDWFSPLRLERLLYHMRQSEVDLVADNVYLADRDLSLSNAQALYIDRFGRVGEMPRLLEGPFLRSLPRIIGPVEFMEGHMPGPRNPRFGLMKPLFRRSFLEQHDLRWDESVRYSQDTAFYLSCLMHGARFLVVPEAGYFYNTESEGISGSADPIEAARHRLEINHRFIAEYGEKDPELRRVLQKRGRRLERRIAFLTFERMRREGDRAVLSEMTKQPGEALDFASYWIEEKFWRGVGRARAVRKRLEALRIRHDRDYELRSVL